MPANFNKVILVGNLTRDPEMRYTPKGTAVCKISLAVNRSWKGEDGQTKEEVTFVDVDAFGRTAENIGQYMKKGSPIMIEGRLKLDTWDDKQTGQKRSKLGVAAENVQFLGGGQRGGDDAPAPSGSRQTTATASRPAPAAAPAKEAPDDDVPF